MLIPLHWSSNVRPARPLPANHIRLQLSFETADAPVFAAL